MESFWRCKGCISQLNDINLAILFLIKSNAQVRVKLSSITTRGV